MFWSVIFVATLLGLAIADPREDCDLPCPPGPQNVRFEPGKTYVYRNEQHMREKQISLPPIKFSMHGEILVFAISECLMALKFSNVTIDEISPHFISPDLTPEEIVQYPLYFRFENGQIKKVCPYSEDHPIPLSMKNASLAAIQSNWDHMGTSFPETDMYGTCETTYSVVNTTRRGILLNKVKNMNDCDYKTPLIYPLKNGGKVEYSVLTQTYNQTYIDKVLKKAQSYEDLELIFIIPDAEENFTVPASSVYIMNLHNISDEMVILIEEQEHSKISLMTKGMDQDISIEKQEDAYNEEEKSRVLHDWVLSRKKMMQNKLHKSEGASKVKKISALENICMQSAKNVQEYTKCIRTEMLRASFSKAIKQHRNIGPASRTHPNYFQFKGHDKRIEVTTERIPPKKHTSKKPWADKNLHQMENSSYEEQEEADEPDITTETYTVDPSKLGTWSSRTIQRQKTGVEGEFGDITSNEFRQTTTLDPSEWGTWHETTMSPSGNLYWWAFGSEDEFGEIPDDIFGSPGETTTLDPGEWGKWHEAVSKKFVPSKPEMTFTKKSEWEGKDTEEVSEQSTEEPSEYGYEDTDVHDPREHSKTISFSKSSMPPPKPSPKTSVHLPSVLPTASRSEDLTKSDTIYDSELEDAEDSFSYGRHFREHPHHPDERMEDQVSA